MVGVFADDHLGQQPWAGQPLLDRLGKPFSNDHVGLARLAGVLGPYMLDHDHRLAGLNSSCFADFLADAGADGTAVGTRELFGGNVVDLALALQALGQWLTTVTVLLGGIRLAIRFDRLRVGGR